MQVPAHYVQVYGDGIDPPAGMVASQGTGVNLPANYPARLAWNYAYPATGGPSHELRLADVPFPPPEDARDWVWPYELTNPLRECFIEAEFEGLQPGSNVVLEFAMGRHYIGPSDGWEPALGSRLYIVLEYRAGGVWAVVHFDYPYNI